MRALVTGATGFLGRHLVAELRRRDWTVVCIVRHSVESGDPGVQCVRGDLMEPSSLRFDLEGGADALFHFAAQLPAREISLEQYLTANCTATARLLELAERASVKSVVYASSLPVIGTPGQIPITENHSARPGNPYHLSKLCGEMVCETTRRATGRRVSSLRITSPYGPGMPLTVLARFVERVLKGESIQWIGSGSRAQNFVHVSDVVNATLLAAETDSPGLYNVGSSETTNMRELAQIVARLATGSENLASSAGGVDPEEAYRWEVDISRAASGLGYRPAVSLEQGITDCIRWVQSKAAAPRWWKP